MKKWFTLVFLLNALQVFCQVTLILRPDGIEGKDALIDNRYAVINENFGNMEDLSAWAFTNGGGTVTRSLFQFNLNNIPKDAIIKSAKLSLYCNTNSPMTQLHTGRNACSIQRITSSWSESTVTWNTQPSSTSSNQVRLEGSQYNTQNYTDIDMKQLIIEMINKPSSSFGFMMRLQNEMPNSSMVFASSDHPDSTKRPTLVVTYLPPCTNNFLLLQPGPDEGKDALIDSRTDVSKTNFGFTSDFASWSWTNSSQYTIARSLIQFDLSKFPKGALVSSASLSLFCNTSSGIPQLHSGLNESYLQKVINPWNENTVSWFNQPKSTDKKQVLLSTSDYFNQDYLNIDVTELITDMVNQPDSNFGFMLKLKNEQTYRSLILASSDHADSTKWPRLKICHTIPSAIEKTLDNTNRQWTVYPNPTNGNFIVESKNNSQPYSIRLINLNGELVLERKNVLSQQCEMNMNAGNKVAGIYILEIKCEEEILFKKIFIN
jgi:hypothetical protein